MKALLLLTLLLAAPAFAQNAPEASGETRSIENPDLRAELLAMVEADQAIRQKLIAAGMAEPDPAILAEMMATDARHLARVIEIVDAHGWPGADLVGSDGSEAAFLIIQHGDLATQERMLPLVEAAYRAGDLSGQSYALLLDRVLMRQGKPQVYGTQAAPFEEWVDGEPIAAPIADEETVDARRAEVGLPPLAAYLAMLKAFYFPEAATDDASGDAQ